MLSGQQVFFPGLDVEMAGGSMPVGKSRRVLQKDTAIVRAACYGCSSITELSIFLQTLPVVNWLF